MAACRLPESAASLLKAVAKWLCQNSAIFSCSGRRVWIMRNIQRWRASSMSMSGANRFARGHLRVIGPSDARIDVVGPAFVVHEMRDRGGRRHVAEGLDVRGAGAESGAAEQVIDFRIELGHGFPCVTDQSAIVTTPSVKVVAY